MTSIFDFIEQTKPSNSSNDILLEHLNKRKISNKNKRTSTKKEKNSISGETKKQINADLNSMDIFKLLNDFENKTTNNLKEDNTEEISEIISIPKMPKTTAIKSECTNIEDIKKSFNHDLEYQYDIGQNYKFDSRTKISKKESKYTTKVMTKGCGILLKDDWINLIQEEANRLNETFLIDKLEKYYKQTSFTNHNSDKSIYFTQAIEAYSLRIWENEEWAGYKEFNKILN